MIQFTPCSKCSNGYLFKGEGPDEYVIKCSCLKQFQELVKLQHRMNDSGIPPESIKYSIDSYVGTKSLSSVKKVKKYGSEFSLRYSHVHLYLHGPNGTQKTTLAQWIGRKVLTQGCTVQYLLMNTLIGTLTKEGFEANIDDEIERLQNVDLLILDESFDKEKMRWFKSGYQLGFLDSFLRTRLEYQKKAVVFISNKPMTYIKEGFNNSLFDLIRRNTIGGTMDFVDHYTSGVILSREDFNSMWD